ncbi:MAG: hypothetical protein HY716_14300 [Planctomycetes bacterium]|nr:hypothetical protein [Planctomycetota bacterium]
MARELAMMLAVYLPASATYAQDPAKPQDLSIQAGDWKLKFYGFLRLDVLIDDSKPNDPQVIQWVRSEDDAAIPLGFGAENGDEQFNMHPKLTRLGIDVAAPRIEALGQALPTGKLEIDFYNFTQSESRDLPRIRHAFLRLGWTETALVLGQREDVISPLYPVVNNDIVMWNAGNLGDRRPQIRFEVAPEPGEGSKAVLQVMAGLTGANDGQNLDGATPSSFSPASTLDGIDSGLPTLQARVAYQGRHLWMENKEWEIGTWGHTAQEKLPEGAAPINGEDSWTSTAFGLDLTLPLWEALDLKAEVWAGRNLDDVRGGIGQGVNNTAGDPNQGQEIDARGGWVEVGYQALDCWTVYLGYSFDDPDDNLPASGARDKNVIVYLANRLKFGNVAFGADYLNWTTEWSGGFKDGTDNRFNLFAQFNF